MIIKRPKGATQVLNKNHEDGFLPLPIRVQTITHNKQPHVSIVTAWEMTPEEIKQVQAGGIIEISLMTPRMVGILPYVVPAEDPIKPTELQTLIDDVDSALSKLRGHFYRALDDATGFNERGCPDAIKTANWASAGIRNVDDLIDRLKGVG